MIPDLFIQPIYCVEWWHLGSPLLFADLSHKQITAWQRIPSLDPVLLHSVSSWLTCGHVMACLWLRYGKLECKASHSVRYMGWMNMYGMGQIWPSAILLSGIGLGRHCGLKSLWYFCLFRYKHTSNNMQLTHIGAVISPFQQGMYDSFPDEVRLSNIVCFLLRYPYNWNMHRGYLFFACWYFNLHHLSWL